MANIESSTGLYVHSENEKGKGDCTVFNKDEILYGKLRPYLNKVYFAEFNGGCSTEFLVLTSIDSMVISNKFISIFLLLDCVVNQTKYMMTGNTLPRLQTFDLENLLIPIPSKNMQHKIINIMENAYSSKKDKEEQAQKIIDGIDDYLLEELGISLPEEPGNTIQNRTFNVGFNDIFNSRFDSMYFSQYYKDIHNTLKESIYPTVKLIDISINIFQGINQNLSHNSNNILLKVKNIKKDNEISFCDTEFIHHIPKNKLLKNGDIITPFIGEAIKQYKFSVFAKRDESINYCVDNNTGVIRLKQNIDPVYVSSFFMSRLGIALVKQLIGGGGVPFLGANNAKKLILLLPDIDIQRKISKEINTRRQKAKILQNEALNELEKAKIEVEKIILGDSYES